MTRAEDELYITGAGSADNKSGRKSWYQVVREGLNQAARAEFSYPDFVEEYENEIFFISKTGDKITAETPQVMEKQALTPLPEIFKRPVIIPPAT